MEQHIPKQRVALVLEDLEQIADRARAASEGERPHLVAPVLVARSAHHYDRTPQQKQQPTQALFSRRLRIGHGSLVLAHGDRIIGIMASRDKQPPRRRKIRTVPTVLTTS